MHRRDLLRYAGAGSLALATGGLVALRPARAQLAAAPNLPPVFGRYTFFSTAEKAFVDAALERLIPADDLSPGALEAGVTLFIDQQLAGRFGQAADWYMQGPFGEGTKEQGYQSPLTPAGLYRAAIRAVDAHCRDAHGGKVFAALDPDARDAVLEGLEQGKLELAGVSGKTFFDVLWHNVQEGFFADPIYEGNRDFIGWKLVGFPGPRYNYVGDIARFGQPYERPTVGLMGRDPSRRPGREPSA